MHAELNPAPATPRRSTGHTRALMAVIALAALIAAAMWLAPMHSGAGDLDALPAPSALGVQSKPDELPAASAASSMAGATFHADAKLDHLAAEPDPSPAAVAAYGP